MPETTPIIVVGFDGSAAAHAALSRGIERVGSTGMLYLVHAWDPPESWRGRDLYQPLMNRAIDDAEALVARAQETHRDLASVRWERELIAGPPAKAIADVAQVRRADEIILGTRGFGRVRALLGSVAHEVIHLAECPVTVIPERMAPPEGKPESADAATTAA